MIEKLDKKIEYVEISILGNKKAECLDFEAGRKLNLKINELVDAVNELHEEAENNARIRADHEHKIERLQKDYDNVCIWVGEQKLKAPVDPYAEQRKWIGKLCRCWDSDINDDIWGILQDIKDNKTEKYYLYGIGYEHCEPVKQDDDIIYKGEQ